ncbi:hypothetical protein BBO_00948 [Beauveria brongniartii RCEF 3172]|uniref:Uncharacterized protein n=1 Tax=Beauveria brongniartii RCEF 3172 TaxID=1081107 RepID=A0A167JZ36_9HYPO|nr:hypothetical protein BBO_00948 [Beauveria brongniartii RCEF 3172]
MPVDKSGALMIVADDQDSWMQAYQALGRGGRVVRHKKLPSKPSKSFRFLAWSAGMPSKSTYLRKTSDVLPENTWYDGTHMRYQESNPRFRWLARGRHSRRDDDDDDDDCCGSMAHAPGGSCCADCANHSLPWGGQPALAPLAGYPQAEYAQADYANLYDSYGQYMPASQPCQEVQWALPGPPPPPPHADAVAGTQRRGQQLDLAGWANWPRALQQALIDAHLRRVGDESRRGAVSLWVGTGRGGGMGKGKEEEG